MSGGGQQTSTQKTTSAPWLGEQPMAKAYLDALMGLAFPNATQPSNYLPAGWNFGQGAAGTQPGQGATAAAGANQIATPGLDQNLAYQLAAPMIGGSNYLQNLFAQNPGMITSAMSPAAFNQLAGIYGNLGGSTG